MTWSTVIFLGMAMVSTLLLMGIIIFGTRKTNEMKTLERKIGQNSEDVEGSIQQLQKALKESEIEKAQIMKRLQNLEAIVTSEAWESIQSGEETATIQLHLEDEEKEELDDSAKAAQMAKRVR